RRLLAYSWPGNVRELSNVVERATVVCSGSSIGVADLPPEVGGPAGPGAEAEPEAAAPGAGPPSAQGAAEAPPPESYQGAMVDFERQLVAATLQRTGGDRREAARLLGVSLATLYRRIEKLGLKGTGAPGRGDRS